MARAALAAMRAPKRILLPSPPPTSAWTPFSQGGRQRPAALLVGPARVEPQAAIEEVLRPGTELRTSVEVVGARDGEQALLGEGEGLADLPALEAQSRVPVEKAAVGPVAEQHALDPGGQHVVIAARQRRHAGGARPRVPEQEVHGDVRVLGRVEIEGVARRSRGQVVEAISGAQVGRAAVVRAARGGRPSTAGARPPRSGACAGSSRGAAARCRRSSSRRGRRPRSSS